MSTLDIRSAIALWETKSFEDWVENTYWNNVEVRKELIKQLKALKLADKKINGFSVMGLEQSQEGTGGVGVSYTDTFFKMVEKTKGCNPIDFLYLIVKESVNNGYSEAKTRGIMARGMRTFASLLRDHDFAHKMEQELERRNLSNELKVSTGSEEDSKNHTDVLVSSNKNYYRIWLFQFSRRGLPHDIERLTELRGKLPKGIHILCPLKSEYQRDLETISKRITRLTRMIDSGREKEKLAKKETRALEALRNKLNVYSQALTESKTKETELKGQLNGNIEPYCGWYLYGGKAVTETLDAIVEIDNGNTNAKPYMEVYSMLNAPKVYLSNLSSFQI